MKTLSLSLMSLALAVLPAAAHAGIDKTPNPACDACFFVWPSITLPVGWQHDEAASRANDMNVIVPTGQVAKTADVIIYGNADLGDAPEATLDDYITADLTSFNIGDPDIKVTEQTPMTTADGSSLRAFQLDPGKADGRWEMTAYGEQTDADNNRYFVIFVLSGADQAHRDDNMSAFRGIILNYRK